MLLSVPPEILAASVAAAGCVQATLHIGAVQHHLLCKGIKI